MSSHMVEEVYKEQPRVFITYGEYKVCKTQKANYVPKKGHGMWFNKPTNFDFGFAADKKIPARLVVLIVYVNDGIFS